MALQKCGLNLNRACKELQPHGTLEFPCAGYSERYTSHPEDAIPWHWHEELEILYLKAGRMKLQIPGKTFHMAERDVFIVNSGVLHSAAAEPDCQLQSVVFSSLLVTGSAASILASKYIGPLTACASFDGCPLNGLLETADAANDFTAAFEALAAGAPGYEFIVRERLSAICLALYRHFERDICVGPVELGQDGVRMRKMLDFIHSRFSEDIGLAEIAKAADIGERECLRCFQRTIQVSPVQYLLKYRITQGASLLLRNPSGSVSEIAGRCGFDSSSNFSQTFKKFFLCTPREYRKGNQP